MKYRHIYTALKRMGFSPAKAAEVLLDARRRDKYARAFVMIAFQQRRNAA